MTNTNHDSLTARSIAAQSYKPKKIHTLFIAEAPPCGEDRYFYFEDVSKHDPLWVELTRTLYGGEFGAASDERKRKKFWLRRFCDDGCYLIDSVETPELPKPAKERLKLIQSNAPRLIKIINTFNPKRVILIKATVYDGLYASLRAANLPVVNKRIPFPGSGQQKKFRVEMQHALGEKY